MQLMRGAAAKAVSWAAALAVAGCTAVPGATEKPWERANLVQGPPIEDIVTAFDSALGCLRGKIKRNVVFAVGTVTDNTGKETYNDGGSGKMVTQGAGDMVQSALFRSGVTVVNRSQVNVSVIEATWGIRDIKSQVPVNFYISGSINSLDYIPGGGYEVSVAGFGPKKRQSRIMVGLDLSMVDAFTGRVVASIPLQKQIYMSEAGFSGTQFFGDTLVSLDAGGMEREAMNFALRQMVSLATFELLGQVMNPGVYAQCRGLVPGGAGAVEHNGTADTSVYEVSGQTGNDLNVPVERALPPPAVPPQGQAPGQPVPPGMLPAPPQESAPQGGQPDPKGEQPRSPRGDASLLGKEATKTATRAIQTAKKSQTAENAIDRMKLAAEAIQMANLALKLLQEAARLGLDGEEGDVTAVVVQEAMRVAAAAGREAANAAQAEKLTPPAPAEAERKTSEAEPAPAAPAPAGPLLAAKPTPTPTPTPTLQPASMPSVMRIQPPTEMFVAPSPSQGSVMFLPKSGG
ncbi:CsgG/HfaB family protein [Paragemmobacter straminiformis]|uniref:Curli production assembly/transport component CsgG n=1 Tax=Paragemmobacter straminiformis TaxID=2045119 RepID=A0A842I3G0_9RHOB|nr:CsgG/HfaB family protein [Gemmobacter straminiformis]MBC2834141.1 hypothetical protein [Gemmobacter straminiformis]